MNRGRVRPKIKKKKNKIQQNTKAKSAKNSIQIQNSSWGRMRHVHVTLRRQKLRILFNKIQIVAFTARQTGWDLLLLLLLYPYILTNILAIFCRLFCWPSYLRFSSGANFAFNFG